MVKKLKVVDVEDVKPVEEPVENKTEPEVESSSSSEEVKPETPTPVPEVEHVEKVEKVEESKPKKQPDYITCETCNKKILMKTYKYSHQKLCKEKNAPPPPPPTPEPKPRPKRVIKPKQSIETPTEQPKQESDGVVSFNEFQDPYRTMREQRLMVRQQRVKSLISQAI